MNGPLFIVAKSGVGKAAFQLCKTTLLRLDGGLDRGRDEELLGGFLSLNAPDLQLGAGYRNLVILVLVNT